MKNIFKIAFAVIVFVNLILNIIILNNQRYLKSNINNIEWDIDSIDSSISGIKKSLDEIENSINSIESDIDNLEYYLY